MDDHESVQTLPPDSVLRTHSWQYLGDPYEMSVNKSGLFACKARAWTTVLSLQPDSLFLHSYLTVENLILHLSLSFPFPIDSVAPYLWCLLVVLVHTLWF